MTDELDAAYKLLDTVTSALDKTCDMYVEAIQRQIDSLHHTYAALSLVLTALRYGRVEQATKSLKGIADSHLTLELEMQMHLVSFRETLRKEDD